MLGLAKEGLGLAPTLVVNSAVNSGERSAAVPKVRPATKFAERRLAPATRRESAGFESAEMRFL